MITMINYHCQSLSQHKHSVKHLKPFSLTEKQVSTISKKSSKFWLLDFWHLKLQEFQLLIKVCSIYLVLQKNPLTLIVILRVLYTIHSILETATTQNSKEIIIHACFQKNQTLHFNHVI